MSYYLFKSRNFILINYCIHHYSPMGKTHKLIWTMDIWLKLEPIHSLRPQVARSGLGWAPFFASRNAGGKNWVACVPSVARRWRAWGSRKNRLTLWLFNIAMENGSSIDDFNIPLWISPLELPKSSQISPIFLGKIFATFSLCTISCLPPQPGLLILERFFVLDFREIGVFQVWILGPRYFDSKNI